MRVSVVTLHLYTYIYIYIYICACLHTCVVRMVCWCVCVERLCVCVCVFVCVCFLVCVCVHACMHAWMHKLSCPEVHAAHQTQHFKISVFKLTKSMNYMSHFQNSNTLCCCLNKSKISELSEFLTFTLPKLHNF